MVDLIFVALGLLIGCGIVGVVMHWAR